MPKYSPSPWVFQKGIICEILMKKSILIHPKHQKSSYLGIFYPLDPPNGVKNFIIPFLNIPLVPTIPKRYHMLGSQWQKWKYPHSEALCCPRATPSYDIILYYISVTCNIQSVCSFYTESYYSICVILKYTWNIGIWLKLRNMIFLKSRPTCSTILALFVLHCIWFSFLAS